MNEHWKTYMDDFKVKKIYYNEDYKSHPSLSETLENVEYHINNGQVNKILDLIDDGDIQLYLRNKKLNKLKSKL